MYIYDENFKFIFNFIFHQICKINNKIDGPTSISDCHLIPDVVASMPLQA